METKTKHYSAEDGPRLPSNRPLEDTGPHEKEPPFEYKILEGHFEPDNETWKSDQELRMQFFQLTDELIYKMTASETSTVMFLDKSARPLSHLVRALWPICARDLETGEIPP